MAFVVSLVTATLSVFYACLRQQKIRTLLSADELKDWLSRPGIPSVQAGINRTVYIYIRLKQVASEPESRHDVAERDSRLWGLRNRVKAFRDESCWETASFNAVIITKIPALLLNHSTWAFLV